MIGQTLGPYQILDKLGEGGVGVVYRALDVKLQRPVAIKFLSTEFADAAARRRFQREAQLASSLNHPHILTVHDVGEFEGAQYLVTEFVDGGTLSDWAFSDKRTWRQIVDLLVGVADGLAAAHQAGILHRDIKPGNVLVSKSGYAKLADFGLAKLASTPSEDAKTSTIVLTRPGIVVGTVAYMSPEQAAGKVLDARSDIFSFGIVLYELLAEQRPFTGATDREVLQTILHDTPPALEQRLPLALRMIVEKALEKDPADRYQTMRDLVVDLRRVARRQTEESGRVTSGVAIPAPASSRRRMVVLRALAIGLAGMVVGVLAGRWSRAVPPPASPTAIPRVQRITDTVGMEEMPAASPDGKDVAFVAPLNGRRQIWVRRLAGGNTLPITREDIDHSHPRWTPDSNALVYFTAPAKEGDSGTLWEVSALGGTPRPIAPSVGGADVSHDGQRIAAFQKSGEGVALTVLRRDGSPVGSSRPLTTLGGGRELYYLPPRWSPDDRSIAFVVTDGSFWRALQVADAAGGNATTIARATEFRGLDWLPDGSGLVYASSAGSTLSYPPTFNLRTVSKNGGVERQLTVGEESYVEPDLVQAGKLLASRVRMQSEIWRFPVTGSARDNVENRVRITQQTGQVRTPSPSPDGKEIVYLSDSGGHSNLWVAKTDGSGSGRQITYEQDPAVVIGIPTWSPVGDRIAYIQTQAGISSQWVINSDSSGRRQVVPDGVAASWSADGQSLYYARTQQGATCLEKVRVSGGPPVRIRCGAEAAAVSSDESTLYFVPDAAHQNEILKASTKADAPAVPFAWYAPSRIPGFPHGVSALSPDDRWLALPLKDGATTNIWAIPTDRGPFPHFRQITDFGLRAILIARRVAWSRDGKFIYAAVVETDADIVLLDGVVR